MQTILDFFTSGTITLGTVYWACLMIGAALLIISLIFGEIFDFVFDAGEFGPLSGPVVSTFLTLFGGGGLIFRDLIGVGPVASSFAALIIGAGGSSAVYFVFIKLILSQEGGTTYDPKLTAGREAEVITGIPANGTGEITFDVQSGRISGPARSSDGAAIERASVVVIDRFVGGTYYVHKLEATSRSEEKPLQPEMKENPS